MSGGLGGLFHSLKAHTCSYSTFT
uniref:Uncharacterized protein n=1 Tax=Anguilla anguilla TaxID=7936 RepID=A0A0E9RPR9_ANGAN